MKTLNKMLIAFWQEESGLTIVEYALGGTLIAIALIGALKLLASNISVSLNTIGTAVNP